MPEFVNCGKCGKAIPRIAARCEACKAERTHRDAYPDQYAHRLVGKLVNVKTRTGFKTQGTVLRVVVCRFGQLAHLDTSGDTAYLVSDCTPVAAAVV